MKKAFCIFKDKYLSALFMRFLIGGFAGYLFRILFTWGLTEFLALPYFMFYVIAETAATLFNFGVSMKFIFRLKDHVYKRFARFVFFTLIFYGLNILLVHTLALRIHYLLSITIVIGVMALIKFPVFDYFVFHKQFNN